MKTTRSAWTIYVALRLLFFVVPFGIVYWLGLQMQFSLALSGGVAAVIAALIGVSLSVIFLSRPRAQAAQSIADWRNRERTADDIAEDAELDGETHDAAAHDTASDDVAAEEVAAEGPNSEATADPVSAEGVTPDSNAAGTPRA